MKNNSFHFVGDTQWGEHLETPHFIAHSLLIHYPECDFSFSYTNTPLNTFEHVCAHDAKDIVGKNAQNIVLCIGWASLQQSNDILELLPLFDSLIEKLSHIQNSKLFICNQATRSYKKGQLDSVELLNAHIRNFNSKSIVKVDYNAIFDQFHTDQFANRHEPHALHYSNARLTGLGSQLLAETLLLNLKKNITFTPTLKE